jgi:hypothetical protein
MIGEYERAFYGRGAAGKVRRGEQDPGRALFLQRRAHAGIARDDHVAAHLTGDPGGRLGRHGALAGAGQCTHGPGQLPRPARAAMAAALWTIWVLAYLTGMSNASSFAAYHHHTPAGGLSPAADQQIAVAILWTVPALCFPPLLYVTVIAWLGGASSAGNERPAASGSAPADWPLPPRGWRSPRAR